MGSTTEKKIWKLFLGIQVLVVFYIWMMAAGNSGELIRSVPGLVSVEALETPNLYFFIHLFSFLPVFLLSFDKKVHYYRRWGPLLKAILLVGSFFIAWDVFFTDTQVWGFNPLYFSGYLIFKLPVEEWLFFLTVPFASVFIYDCLNTYFPRDQPPPYELPITFLLIGVFFFIGYTNLDKIYTATTFILSGTCLSLHLRFIPDFNRNLFYRAYILSMIPFLLVNGVLTGAFTEQPVVMYNPEEILGIRIGTIPLEDSIYSFLLLFGVISLYEHFKADREKDGDVEKA